MSFCKRSRERTSYMRKFLRSAALQVALLALTVLCVEVLAYFLLPNSIAWRFYDYRRHQHMVADSTPNAVDYYLPNETRGHYIAPGRKKGVFRHTVRSEGYLVQFSSVPTFSGPTRVTN